MERIPFKIFDGFLKQHAPADLTGAERTLFDFLFPSFTDPPDAGPPPLTPAANRLLTAFAPLIQVVPGERRPRRYAGFDFPHGRYHSLCEDADGWDAQTLVHELRAYRDPVDAGMVEVLDLARGCQLMIGRESVSLSPQRAVAVLIHEPAAIPDECHRLAFDRLPGLARDPILLYRFPYRVSRRTFEKTIDLRYPDVRDWFWRTFRVPSDESRSVAVAAATSAVSPTTAHSRFRFENGAPPVPESFWSMLPTLLNPDLGGGNPADTGGTFTMIGHWMRQHAVDGLIYPSARCDSAAVFEGGSLEYSQGWNVIEYIDSRLFGRANVNAITAVPSPWAWVALPHGVELHTVGADSRRAGSFMIKHMVDFWARDYLDQLKALDTARSLHGREPPRDPRRMTPLGLPERAFRIGVLSLRWLRLLVDKSLVDEIDRSVMELTGLALPYGLYPLAGRVAEAWEAVKRQELTPAVAFESALAAGAAVSRCLERRYPGAEFDGLVRTGSDLELVLILLMASRSERSIGPVRGGAPRFLVDATANLSTTWLAEHLRAAALDVLQRGMQAVHDGTPAAGCIEELLQIENRLLQHLRRRSAPSERPPAGAG